MNKLLKQTVVAASLIVMFCGVAQAAGAPFESNFGSPRWLVANGAATFDGAANTATVDATAANVGVDAFHANYFIVWEEFGLLMAGQSYVVQFDALGSGYSRIGSESLAYTDPSAFMAVSNPSPKGSTWFGFDVAGSTPVHESYTFTAGAAGKFGLFFKTTGSMQIGNVSFGTNVTSVPEPESYAMMVLGLGVLGFAGRRRKT